MIKLLLVEDDPNLSYIIQGGLECAIEGYTVIIADNGEEGLKLWKAEQPDIIVADIEMPGMNGYEMVRKIRETDPDIPIIFASARVSPRDVIDGFKLGGNNYIKKPFIPAELHVHIQSLLKLKNNRSTTDQSKIYTIGDFSFEAKTGKLKHKSGEILNLTSKESHILETLVVNKEETVTRESILEKYWDPESMSHSFFYLSRSLDVHITRIRKKLELDPHIEIRSLKGIGLTLIINDSGK